MNSLEKAEEESHAGFRVVSFAGGQAIWARSARRLAKQASGSKFIPSFRLYAPEDLEALSTPGIENFLEYAVKNPRGFGYWVWKPALLLRELDLLGDEAGVAWIDCGCSLNLKGSAARNAWLSYESQARREHFKFFRLVNHRHRSWTKPEAIDALDPSREYLERSLYAATAFFLSNDDASREFLREWLHFVTIDGGRLVDDSPATHEGAPNFIEHRHDQSIMSLILERIGYVGQPDETYFPSSLRRDGRNYPIWATRLRSGFASTSSSLLMVAVRKVERLVVNSVWSFKKGPWNFDKS